MKFIIIGLGNFGSSLAINLTQNGHEVIGVDSKMNKVDAFKESITHTICMDCRDENAAEYLPLQDTDVVIVCIGEDEGANIMSTALMKKLKVKRLLSRAVSPLHRTVLEAMGVDEIIHPEEETAERWTRKLTISGAIESFILSNEYGIIEATVPEKYIGKTLLDINLTKHYEAIILTTIKTISQKNVLGIPRKTKQVQSVASSKTVLEQNDILVIYGRLKDIEQFLEN